MGLFKPNIKKMEAKGDVEGLIEALDHKDWRVNWDAAEALGELGDARAVEPLIKTFSYLKLVKDKFLKDERVRSFTLGSAGLGLERGFVYLGWAALPALVKIGEPAVEPLIEALKDKSEIVRLYVVRALAEMGDSRAVEPLGRALEDKNKDVREEAKEALERIKAKKG